MKLRPSRSSLRLSQSTSYGIGAPHISSISLTRSGSVVSCSSLILRRSFRPIGPPYSLRRPARNSVAQTALQSLCLAAVHVDQRALQQPARRADHEGNEIRDVFRIAQSRDFSVADETLGGLGGIRAPCGSLRCQAPFQAIGADRSGIDRIDLDAVRKPMSASALVNESTAAFTEPPIEN